MMIRKSLSYEDYYRAGSEGMDPYRSGKSGMKRPQSCEPCSSGDESLNKNYKEMDIEDEDMDEEDYHDLEDYEDYISDDDEDLLAGDNLGARPRLWTEEEDERLRMAVEHYGGKNWKKIAEAVPGRNSVQCLQHWKHVLHPEVGKGSWTPEEDRKLVRLVGVYGRRWSEIAKYLPKRIGKRCRERYMNHLSPNLRKEPWTEEEEDILLHAREKLGNKWTEIARLLHGRGVNQVKNHWYSMSRRRKTPTMMDTPTSTPISMAAATLSIPHQPNNKNKISYNKPSISKPTPIRAQRIFQNPIEPPKDTPTITAAGHMMYDNSALPALAAAAVELLKRVEQQDYPHYHHSLGQIQNSPPPKADDSWKSISPASSSFPSRSVPKSQGSRKASTKHTVKKFRKSSDETVNVDTMSLESVDCNDECSYDSAFRSPPKKNRLPIDPAAAARGVRWTKEESERLQGVVVSYQLASQEMSGKAKSGEPKQWSHIAAHFPGRTSLQVLQHYQHVANPSIIKGKGSWTKEEDEILKEKVEEFGTKWSKVAAFLPGRVGKQVRERYLNHLDPRLKKGLEWSEEEEKILLEAQKKFNNKWASISKLLVGRSDNDVKNHWYSSMHRRYINGEFGVPAF